LSFQGLINRVSLSTDGFGGAGGGTGGLAASYFFVPQALELLETFWMGEWGCRAAGSAVSPPGCCSLIALGRQAESAHPTHGLNQENYKRNHNGDYIYLELLSEQQGGASDPHQEYNDWIPWLERI